MAALVVGVAAGIGAILDAVPAAEVALKVVGSVYLLYVAYAGPPERPGRSRATSRTRSRLWQGIAFQWVNPKAWVFTIAAVGDVPPADAPPALGVTLLCLILMVVVIGSSSAWAAGGAGLGRFVEDERTRRVDQHRPRRVARGVGRAHLDLVAIGVEVPTSAP